jgi:hypothetical protein
MLNLENQCIGLALQAQHMVYEVGLERMRWTGASFYCAGFAAPQDVQQRHRAVVPCVQPAICLRPAALQAIALVLCVLRAGSLLLPSVVCTSASAVCTLATSMLPQHVLVLLHFVMQYSCPTVAAVKDSWLPGVWPASLCDLPHVRPASNEGFCRGVVWLCRQAGNLY